MPKGKCTRNVNNTVDLACRVRIHSGHQWKFSTLKYRQGLKGQFTAKTMVLLLFMHPNPHDFFSWNTKGEIRNLYAALFDANKSLFLLLSVCQGYKSTINLDQIIEVNILLTIKSLFLTLREFCQNLT